MTDSMLERPRRGRRPGSSDTRQVILDAASSRFARDGYAATIRHVASDAGVDPALVMQYFGSKEQLFGAVMSVDPEAMAELAEAFTGPEATRGALVSSTFLRLFEERRSEPLFAMLRAAITREQAADLLRDFLQARLTQDVDAEHRDDPEMLTRVGLASALLIGVVVARHIVRVPSLAHEDIDKLIARVAPAVQAVLSLDAP